MIIKECVIYIGDLSFDSLYKLTIGKAYKSTSLINKNGIIQVKFIKDDDGVFVFLPGDNAFISLSKYRNILIDQII